MKNNGHKYVVIRCVYTSCCSRLILNREHLKKNTEKMTLQEIKQQTGAIKFAVEDVRSSKMIKQNVYDEHDNVVGVKETPMNEVFKKVVIFLNDNNKQVGSCLLNEVRSNTLKEDPTCLGNAEFSLVTNEWGEDKTPLFKIVGKLYSNVFAI